LRRNPTLKGSGNTKKWDWEGGARVVGLKEAKFKRKRSKFFLGKVSF